MVSLSGRTTVGTNNSSWWGGLCICTCHAWDTRDPRQQDIGLYGADGIGCGIRWLGWHLAVRGDRLWAVQGGWLTGRVSSGSPDTAVGARTPKHLLQARRAGRRATGGGGHVMPLLHALPFSPASISLPGPLAGRHRVAGRRRWRQALRRGVVQEGRRGSGRGDGCGQGHLRCLNSAVMSMTADPNTKGQAFSPCTSQCPRGWTGWSHLRFAWKDIDVQRCWKLVLLRRTKQKSKKRFNVNWFSCLCGGG